MCGARRIDMVAANFAAELERDGEKAQRCCQAGNVGMLADEQAGGELFVFCAVVTAIGELGIAPEDPTIVKHYDGHVFAEPGL